LIGSIIGGGCYGDRKAMSNRRSSTSCALRRAGDYFSCLAKRSNQEKASLRSRRLRRFLPLLGPDGGCRELGRSLRFAPSHALRQRHPTSRPPLRCSAASKAERQLPPLTPALSPRGEGRHAGRRDDYRLCRWRHRGRASL